MGNGQEAAGLRVFLAGVASTDFFAALAAALLPLLAALVSAFFADLLAVDVSVIEPSFLDDFVVFLPAEAAVLAVFFTAAAFFTAEVDGVSAAAVLPAAFLAADFTAVLETFFAAALAGAFLAADFLAAGLASAVAAVFAALAGTFVAEDFAAFTAFFAAGDLAAFAGVFFAAVLLDLVGVDVAL